MKKLPGLTIEYCVYAYYIEGIIAYVGIGNKKRPYEHLVKYTRKDASFFQQHLKKSIDYGMEITMKVLRKGLTAEEAILTEKIIIEMCGRIDLGTGTLYNQTEGGIGVKGFIGTKPFHKLNRKKVIQYTKEGEFVKIWRSIDLAQKALDTTSIQYALKNQSLSKEFQWRYYKENYPTKIKTAADNTKRPWKLKPVMAIAPDREVITYFSMHQAAADLGLKAYNIMAVCQGQKTKTRKKHKGYSFYYLNDEI